MTGKKEKSQRQQKESSQLIEDIFAAVKKTKEEKPVESANPLPKKKTKKTPKLSALPSSKKRSAPHSSSTGEDHQDLDDLFKDVRGNGSSKSNFISNQCLSISWVYREANNRGWFAHYRRGRFKYRQRWRHTWLSF